MSPQTISLPTIGVLAVVTGMTLEQGIGSVYEVCDGMTGDENYTHQLPRVAKEITPALIEQFPWLVEAEKEVKALFARHDEPDYKQLVAEFVATFRARMILKYGERLNVIPIHPEDHEQIDPIEEAQRMMGNKPVIPIVLDDGPSDIGDITPTTR